MKKAILAALLALSVAACGKNSDAPSAQTGPGVVAAANTPVVPSCDSKPHDDSCHWIAHVSYERGELQVSDIACKDMLSVSQFVAFKWKDAAADPSAVAVLMRNKDGDAVAAGCMVKSNALRNVRSITWLKADGLPGAAAESDIRPGATHFDQNGHDAANGLDGALYATSDVAGTLDDPTSQTYRTDEARKTLAAALARKDLHWYRISADPGANDGGLQADCDAPISDIPADLASKPFKYHASEASKIGDNDYMVEYNAPQQGAHLMYFTSRAGCQQIVDKWNADHADQNAAASKPNATASAPDSDAEMGPTFDDKVRRRVRPYIEWNGETQGLETVIAVHCAPTGTLLSATIERSSGNSQWDAAALQAVQHSDPMPSDTNGKTPVSFTITLRPAG
jgi:TonB family protein